MVEYLVFKAVGRLGLHIRLPTHVAHTGDNADIRWICNKCVIWIGSHTHGYLNHEAIHPDLSLLSDADDTAVIFKLLHDLNCVLDLVVIDILRGRGIVALEEFTAVSQDRSVIVGGHLGAIGTNHLSWLVLCGTETCEHFNFSVIQKKDVMVLFFWFFFFGSFL